MILCMVNDKSPDKKTFYQGFVHPQATSNLLNSRFLISAEIIYYKYLEIQILFAIANCEAGIGLYSVNFVINFICTGLVIRFRRTILLFLCHCSRQAVERCFYAMRDE